MSKIYFIFFMLFLSSTLSFFAQDDHIGASPAEKNELDCKCKLDTFHIRTYKQLFPPKLGFSSIEDIIKINMPFTLVPPESEPDLYLTEISDEHEYYCRTFPITSDIVDSCETINSNEENSCSTCKYIFTGIIQLVRTPIDFPKYDDMEVLSRYSLTNEKVSECEETSAFASSFKALLLHRPLDIPQLSIEVFPNPSTSSLVQIHIFQQLKAQNTDLFVIQLFNIYGQEILKKKITRNNNQTSIFSLSVENLPKGLYVVKATNAKNEIATEKLIIE